MKMFRTLLPLLNENQFEKLPLDLTLPPPPNTKINAYNLNVCTKAIKDLSSM